RRRDSCRLDLERRLGVAAREIEAGLPAWCPGHEHPTDEHEEPVNEQREDDDQNDADEDLLDDAALVAVREEVAEALDPDEDPDGNEADRAHGRDPEAGEGDGAREGELHLPEATPGAVPDGCRRGANRWVDRGEGIRYRPRHEG